MNGVTKMAQQDRGHYAQKHAPHKKLNQRIAKVVREKAENGEMSCAVAFKIAHELGALPPRWVLPWIY